MLKHIHSFVRYKKTVRTIYFKCNDPNCTTTYDREMLIGKLTLCPNCKETTFILTKEDLKRCVPKCLACRNTKEARLRRGARALAASLLGEEELNES